MPHNLIFVAANSNEPCAETQAMRPSTGLNARERTEATSMVKLLMRCALDLIPEGEALSEEAKARAYAQAAREMARKWRRPVSVRQIELVAASMRNGNSPRQRHSTNLTPQHHALLKAEAAATGESIEAIMRRIVDSYYELPAAA